MGNMKRKKANRNPKRKFFDNRDKGEKKSDRRSQRHHEQNYLRGAAFGDLNIEDYEEYMDDNRQN
jgi:hypothetical protein|tara:strand:+ start:605 stop:799 length:195 start_codon:yes stop_codon:yes gene_type:complete